MAEIDDRGRIIYRAACEPDRIWDSAGSLADDYWAHQRLPSREQERGDLAAWFCVGELVDACESPRVLDVFDELLARATGDEIGLVAAGPLEELLVSKTQGPKFVEAVETRARRDARWSAAVAGVWLDRDADAEVNRRMSKFGARFADGSSPS